jgi:hypothetical protein
MPAKMASGERKRDENVTLDEFANRFADQEAGSWLPDLGPVSRQLTQRIGNESITASMLATNFWRAWLSSNRAEAILRRHGASPAEMAQRKTIIVPRLSLNRFDLIVFDPGLGSDFPPTRIELNEYIPVEELQFGARLSAMSNPLRYFWEDAPTAAAESFGGGNQPYSIILASSPRLERLYVPSTPLDVFDASINQHSTAGAVVEDLTRKGRVGVTAALHGIDPTSASITVDGKVGTVVRTHVITDSVFIEVPNPSCGAVNAKGVVAGLAPRGSQNADFVGAVSNRRTTKIVGWDPQVPTPSPHRQACIYTGRDAQPGDSGCALVTDDDWIVGFAFERTLPGQSPVQCSWVWAESVMNGLQVKLI